MRKSYLVKYLLVLLVAVLINSTVWADDDNLKIASYAIGFDIGMKLKESANMVDSGKFEEGLEDFFAKKEPIYSQEQISEAAQKLDDYMQEQIQDKSKGITPEMMASLQMPVELKAILSYSSGYMMGVQLAEGAELVDSSAMFEGLKQSAAGKSSKYTQKQLSIGMAEFGKLFAQKMNDKMKSVAEPNIEAGKEYMQKYTQEDGVKVTPEGIAYKVLKVGAGASPKATDTVKVDYVGKLIDGSEFDSSIKRGEPAEFNIQEVIDGWKLIVPQMKVGDKWEIVVPYEQAYGLQGQPYGEVPIKPGDTLVFEIELLDIK